MATPRADWRPRQGEIRNNNTMIPNYSDLPRINVSANRLTTGRLLELVALCRHDQFQTRCAARIQTDSGERIAEYRIPVSALRGWKSFCRAAIAAGLALDPASAPSDWRRSVYNAARRGEGGAK